MITNEPADSTLRHVAAAHVELAHLRLQDAAGAPREQADAAYEAALAECNAVLSVRKDYVDAYRQRAASVAGDGYVKSMQTYVKAAQAAVGGQ